MTEKRGGIKVSYATLIGRVDSTITYLEQMTAQQTFDWFHIVQVSEMLKAALLEAEEQYIEADDEPALIVLPPRDANSQS